MRAVGFRGADITWDQDGPLRLYNDAGQTRSARGLPVAEARVGRVFRLGLLDSVFGFGDHPQRPFRPVGADCTGAIVDQVVVGDFVDRSDLVVVGGQATT